MTFARKNTSRAKAALPKRERRMRAARMWGHALSLKMIRRNFWLVVLATILFLGVWMIYMTMTTSKDGHPVNRRYGSWIELGKALALNNIPDTDRKVEFYRPAEQYEPHGNHTWEHSVPWRAEFMGRVNLHVFEDWCGSSIKQLRRNLHFPLYPHSRTTISKLAVTPQWTNYALRIFGYLHPAADDDYQFGISSDDNSEFWLSEDETVGKLQLLCRVGPPGNQWTAPGEFEKFQSQRSQFIRLSASRRYYFELLHKQDDAGTDHVELAWRLAALGSPFTLIDSQFLSLYSDESQLPLGDTSYTPQTSASHPSLCADAHPADMLKPDPRDDIYKVPLLSMKRLHKVLPSCPYKPSYLVSGYPLQRYQGLHFVRLTYVYPNDFTRLSHMEKENNCMYQVQLRHSDRHIYNRYMEMEALDNQGGDDVYNPSDFQYEDMQNGAKEAGDYAYNVPGKHRKLLGELPVKVVESGEKEVPDHRKVISSETPRNWTERPPNSLQKSQKPHGMSSDATVKPPSERKVPGSRSTSIPRQRVDRAGEKQQRNIRKEGTGSILEGRGLELGTDHRSSIRDRMRLSEVGKKQDLDNEIHKTGKETVGPPSTVATRATMNKELRQRPKRKVKQMSQQGEAVNQVSKPVSGMGEEMQKRSRQEDGGEETRRGQPILETFSQRQGIRQSEGERQTFENLEGRRQAGRQGEDVKQGLGKDGGEDFGRDREVQQRKPDERRGQEPAQITDTNRLSVMEPEKEVNVELYKQDEESPEYEEEDEEEEEMDYPFIFEQPVGWNRTFNAGQTDFQIVRSDSIDLQCNTSGNLLLREREALSVTRTFMKKLNQNYRGVYQLWRIVNVEKRVDYERGSRYFLELELKGRSDRILRLSQYVFAPGWNGLSPEDRDDEREMRNMMLGSRRRLMGAEEQMELCWPLGLIWNPQATVYFIVPVKNQARWVQKFIWDMEVLYKTTSDAKFSVIIVDFSSTDLDVTSALKQSRIPSYEIITLQGNFERSAGLQAGINVVKNPHSILFLCDLHMHFPPSSIDLVRTHTVEGKMVFAPIVMRLNCGASPCWPDGYWEVNGFGLLGIYKSDLDRIGGMNTAEFRDRWGGEDWELLDRILQAGLEVERLYVRNFFHHFHSKRGMWNRRQAPGGQ